MKVIMPQLGETVNEGTISVWYKKVGDTVTINQALLDVETDKAAVEVPVPAAGVISAIHVEAGETVDVGTLLAVIDVPGEVDAGAVAADPAVVEEATVDAATADTDAVKDDVVQSVGEPENRVESSAEVILTATNPSVAKAGGMLSPAVRRLIAEHELDIATVPATGKRGRTTRQDVLAYLQTRGTASSGSRPSILTPVAPLTDELLPFDRIRKLTAEHMVMSKATSPHVLQAVEVDYSAVDAVRKSVGANWKAEHGYSLTYLPFIARAIALTIHEYPRVNASIVGDALQLHGKINIAIAVDLNFAGLVAPVVKDCAKKSVTQLAGEIRALSQKARAGKLSPDDFAHGTYTISNSGPFGTLLTAPVINQPQVAIISTDGIRKRAVVIESELGDAIAIRPVGILAQSFDHRAFDGAYSAAFLNRLRDILEQHDWSSEL